MNRDRTKINNSQNRLIDRVSLEHNDLTFFFPMAKIRFCITIVFNNLNPNDFIQFIN